MWSDPTEVKQATELLSRWTEVDVDDALELLGPTFKNKAVRAYAVERLRKADDDVLPNLCAGLIIGTVVVLVTAGPGAEIREYNVVKVNRPNVRFLPRSLPHHTLDSEPTVGKQLSLVSHGGMRRPDVLISQDVCQSRLSVHEELIGDYRRC